MNQYLNLTPINIRKIQKMKYFTSHLLILLSVSTGEE